MLLFRPERDPRLQDLLTPALLPPRMLPTPAGFLVGGCMFMEFLDGTIVSTAAPRIGTGRRPSDSWS
jgi:hypothetical protein